MILIADGLFSTCASFHRIRRHLKLAVLSVVTRSNNMQISVLGGGVDTVSDGHLQVTGFDSRRCPILLCLFQIQQDMIYVTLL